MQFTAAQFEKFLKLKSLLSHQVPDQKNADVLDVLFDLYLNRKLGIECGSNYKVQIDHYIPVALGGRTELSNLRLLCSTCNAMAARNLGLGYETTSYFIKT